MGRARARPRGLRHGAARSRSTGLPDFSPDLRESCRKAPADCRATAEQLAHDWSTDEQAFGALKAFAAACEAGDAPACEAVDTRFRPPRYLGSRPVPHLSPRVLAEQSRGVEGDVPESRARGRFPPVA